MARQTVLVVEDDPLVRRTTVDLLEDAGLEVVSMDNADDAIAYAVEHPFGVAAILTDVQMPGHSDGLHLAELVSRHWPHILVIMCSGRVQPLEPLPGNTKFVSKPWQPGELVPLLRQAISS